MPGLGDLAAKGVGGATAGLLRPECARLLAPVGQQARVAVALAGVVGVGGLVLASRPGAGVFVFLPGSGVLVHFAGLGLDLDDPVDGPVEERAVVRDEHDAGGEAVEEA